MNCWFFSCQICMSWSWSVHPYHCCQTKMYTTFLFFFGSYYPAFMLMGWVYIYFTFKKFLLLKKHTDEIKQQCHCSSKKYFTSPERKVERKQYKKNCEALSWSDGRDARRNAMGGHESAETDSFLMSFQMPFHHILKLAKAACTISTVS